MEAGERIKELRVGLGLTQEELGERLGVQKSAIAKWENGRVKNLKQRHILAMAELFNVAPSYVMAMDDQEPPEKDESMVKLGEEKGVYKLDDEEIELLNLFIRLNSEGKSELLKHAGLLSNVDFYLGDSDQVVEHIE